MTTRTRSASAAIDALVDKADILPSGMMQYWQIVAILENLRDVLDRGIPGDVVELGCNEGTTTIFLRRLLDAYGSSKTLHVYDSWQGLPEKHRHDEFDHRGYRFERGVFSVARERLVGNLESRGLRLPVIHSGFFRDIPDEEYPDRICFAFFDGDFYTSILDSFEKTFHKVEPGGVIIIDDCGWPPLPGVRRACEEFLADKPERLELTAYPDDGGVYGGCHGGGRIIKQ